MILTGSEIVRERAAGRITIDPFEPSQVNPNSYNFRLGPVLRVYTQSPLDPRTANSYEEVRIPDEGYVLEPGRLYLAHTEEVLGGRYYAPTFAARSSVARLGMFINLSASLGDIGYEGQWTLQLFTVNRVRVYLGMNIGQMMWWKPQGEVDLYDGKYQGSVGPRSSDIHRDFHRHLARHRFPGLEAEPDPDRTGAKFASLATASRGHPVPPAFAVPASEFAGAVEPAALTGMHEVFGELRATVGAFLTESMDRISRIAEGIRVPGGTRRLIAERLIDVFGSGAGDLRFAVRSSGLDEDSASGSLAGVHQSLLGVRGADGVADAVEECWRSYYSPPAVAARVRAGDFDPMPRLAVFVQRMVDPELAGVAFTGLDGDSSVVTVEYVEGLAEQLVAGTAQATSVTSADLNSLDAQHRTDVDDSHRPALTEVITLARRLRTERGHDVDLEWAATTEHGRPAVHVIQVRPVTARRTAGGPGGPAGLWTSRLYHDQLPPGAALHEVEAVYTGYTAKRGPAHQLAASLGVTTGAGWVIGFTPRALLDPESVRRLETTLAGGRAPECVLDLGETLRQIVVPREQVLTRLRQVTGGFPADSEHAVLVRDFVRGDLGVISRAAGGGLVVEYTPEGLLALNRGTAGAQAVVVNADGGITAPPDAGPVLRHLDTVRRLTAAMERRYGQLTLEWVLSGDDLVFVDYSVLGADQITTGAAGASISPGTASGPVHTLHDDELLTRLSVGPAVSIDRTRDVTQYEGLARLIDEVSALPEPPVVRAARPYAVLSVLIGQVAGFVFDQGSALCHLAILLREAGVPAVAAGLTEVPDGAQAVIADGSVTVVSLSRNPDPTGRLDGSR
ncbi:hypothetical protein KIH74_30610 [Kineosporia sp. J2-2]|uniref:Deoxycytidine triphosphate deaminase n=1 Tax=Kineosporia corallincola TaxID=2835133 RepID=A0ABS5TQG9_9ACTN|nr:PEP/pyruvate-binding domain-containing protein [Kineosporia corallincola]MBT0773337.1 hypothetical protein [Kineosporia corallincola]